MSGIAVRVGANSSEFSKAMTEMKNELKQTKEEFGVAATKAKLFGSETDQLKVKQQQLGAVISQQVKMLETYKGRNETLLKSIGDLNKKQVDLKSKINELNAEYKKSVAETGKSSDASKKLKEEIEKLQKEYTKNKSTIDRNTSAVNKNKTAINNLEKNILKNKATLKETDDKLKEVTSSFGKLSEAAEKTGEKVKSGFSKIKDSAGKIASGFAGIAGVGITGFVNNYEKAMNRFEAKSYSGQRATEEFGNIMKEVYSDNFGENFDDIGNVIGLMNKTLHIAGEELKNNAEYALGLRDAFEVDINESVRSAKALMDTFGVSAEEAFNLIAQGEQNGLDYSNELMDSINEYSVQFGKLGLTAEDMFDIFQAGADNGAWNLDKVGDAVKEFSIRAIDGSKTTQEGFTELGFNADELASKFAKGGDVAKESFFQVVEAISEVEDPVRQSAIGVELFGTMWEDLGPQVVNSLANIESSYDRTEQSAKRLNEVQYNDIGSALKGLGREFMVSVIQPVQNDLMPTINSVVGEIKNKMPEIKTVFGNIVSAVVGSIKFLIDNFNTLKPILITALAAFISFKTVTGVASSINNVTNAIKNVKTAITGIKTAYATIKGLNIASRLTSVIGIVKGAVSGLFTLIMAHPVIAVITVVIGAIILLWNKCEWFRNGVKSILEWIKNAFGVVCEFVKSAWSGLCDFLGTAFNASMVVIMFAWEILKAAFTVVCDVIKSFWSILCKFLYETFKPQIEAINISIEYFKIGFNIVCEFLKNIWKSLCDWISSVWNSAIDWINNKIEFWRAVFSSVSDWMGSKWQGICSLFSSVWDSTIGWINNKIEFWRAAFSSVSDWMGSKWQSVCNYFSSVWDGIVNNIIWAWNKIKSPFESVVNSIRNAWNSLRGSFKLPHFRMSGEFSLNPPSVPSIGIDWYWKGGIFKSPTVLPGGIGVGDKFKGRGNNSEAVVPLDEMYRKIREIIEDESNPKDSGPFIIQNILDGKVISEDVYRIVEGKLVRSSRRG